MAAHWDAPLSRVLTPRGERLVTLRDAARYLTERFANLTHDMALERAIELLMLAAGTGELAERKRATDQIAMVLRDRTALSQVSCWRMPKGPAVVWTVAAGPLGFASERTLATPLTPHRLRGSRNRKAPPDPQRSLPACRQPRPSGPFWRLNPRI
jgi:hypothetical protein